MRNSHEHISAPCTTYTGRKCVRDSPVYYVHGAISGTVTLGTRTQCPRRAINIPWNFLMISEHFPLCWMLLYEFCSHDRVTKFAQNLFQDVMFYVWFTLRNTIFAAQYTLNVRGISLRYTYEVSLDIDMFP